MEAGGEKGLKNCAWPMYDDSKGLGQAFSFTTVPNSARDYIDMAPSREPHYLQCREEVEDLIELQSGVWDEELVLQNCRARFLAGKPYIGAGSVTIAVNPCRSLNELYDRDMQVPAAVDLLCRSCIHLFVLVHPVPLNPCMGLFSVVLRVQYGTHLQFRYIKYNIIDLRVHVYATSATAYWRLSEGQGRQTILLAGESGSGKSFTASVLLEHLVEAAEMSRRVYGTTAQNERGAFPGGMTTVEDDGGNETGRLRKLVANRRVILETFGNAGTVSGDEGAWFLSAFPLERVFLIALWRNGIVAGGIADTVGFERHVLPPRDAHPAFFR